MLTDGIYFANGDRGRRLLWLGGHCCCCGGGVGGGFGGFAFFIKVVMLLFRRVYGDRCHFLGWRAGIYLVQGQNRDRRAALRLKVRLQVDARPWGTLEGILVVWNKCKVFFGAHIENNTAVYSVYTNECIAYSNPSNMSVKYIHNILHRRTCSKNIIFFANSK